LGILSSRSADANGETQEAKDDEEGDILGRFARSRARDPFHEDSACVTKICRTSPSK
jgi:hypothetical protein